MASDINPQPIEQKEQPYRDGMVHFILSHSYIVFLFAVVFGLILDVIIPFDIFGGYVYQYVGASMIILGSFLIYWAQSTSKSTKKKMEKEGEPRNFARGPYKYSRNPTHIGLGAMTLGLAFILNSLFGVILVVIASLITKFVFVKEEEALLEEKYGQTYRDYKKQVRTWL